MDNYEEKYKSALKWMQSLYGGLHGATKEEAEHYFPELKESWDEKMRESIIYALRNGGFYSSDKTDEAIAWLEKQGKKKDTCKREIDDSYLQGICDAICEIEKQGEHKPNPYFGTSFEYNGHIWGMCARDNGVDILLDKQLFKHLEKQDEQPIDKVESKFKVGDWITNGRYNRLVVGIDSRHYQFKNGDAKYIDDIDKKYHLWTIQDAKDGDVLYSIDSKQPFIYKERPQFSQARGYCCINKFGEFAVWNTSKCVICTDKYIPATKEQRDKLEKAMLNAGYKWNKEELKLEKI